MKINNPFTLSFGKEPKEYIKRIEQYDEIINDFSSKNSFSNIYVITGLRGSGKTVLLSSLYNYFDTNDDFIAVDLNTRTNMLETLAATLYDKGPVKHKFLKADFSFSFSGLTISLKGSNPVHSISQLLEKMLLSLKKNQKKLVVTIDDIDTNEPIKTFVKEYQSLFRKDLPIYVVMTGLYDIVDNLENQEGLTFLQRSPKRYLLPLDIRMIATNYSKTLDVDNDVALELAKLTKGYAFAYQTLGYLFYESDDKTINDKLISEYDYYLAEYVYKRVYHDLTGKEKRILKLMATRNINTNKELVATGYISNDEISNYKSSLFKKGICDISQRGMIDIILPRFKEYVEFQYRLEGQI